MTAELQAREDALVRVLEWAVAQMKSQHSLGNITDRQELANALLEQVRWRVAREFIDGDLFWAASSLCADCRESEHAPDCDTAMVVRAAKRAGIV